VPTWAPLIAGLCVVLITLGGAPPARASARPPRCRKGTVQVKVGGKVVCVSRKLVLPPPSKTNSIVAQVQGALGFTQLSLKAHSGKRVPSFSQKLGGSWTTAQTRLQKALAGMIAQVRQTAQRPMSEVAVASGAESDPCAAADVLDDYGSDPGMNIVKTSSSASIDGTNVTMGVDSGGVHFGLTTNVKGDTYTMRYDSGEQSCLAYKLPPCPQGDGSLNAYGIKGSTGFSLTVSRAGEVLKSESYSKRITVETRGQVADDAKLDSVDVKYGETTNVVLDGTRLTQYGNRTVRINMRTGGYGPDESVSFGSASAGGASANVAGEQADAKGFAAFVSQTISAYRDRESAWQTANTCAKLKFNPSSGSLTLSPGAQGSLSAAVNAVEGGERAGKASWTLSGQENGTFSPTSTKDPQPTFSYEVSGNPSGDTLSVVVKATSSAGVAQETWSQKLKVIRTIAGTFSGHEEDTLGVIYEWSGTATFTRMSTETGAGIFTLTSGQATVTVSGTGVDGCTHAGTEEIQLAQQGFLTVSGTGKPYQYQIVAPWSNTVLSGEVGITCPEAVTFTESEIPASSAIQSGEVALGANPMGLIKTSPDGLTFDDSASENDVVVGSASWTWSLKGSA
jgi:hypothetical protein